MSIINMSLFFPIPMRILFFILLQLLFKIAFLIPVSSSSSSPCPSSSSCGNITNITYPFRLNTESCAHKHAVFHLDCRNNQTILTSTSSKRFFVQEIHYSSHILLESVLIRIVDPGINRGDISSCPLYSYRADDWPQFSMHYFNKQAVFIHCLSQVNSTKYVKASFCGDDRSHIFGDSSEFYSYITYGDDLRVSDLEESCTVDKVAWVSVESFMNTSLLTDVYDALGGGYRLLWMKDHNKCFKYPLFVNIEYDVRWGRFITDSTFCCGSSSLSGCGKFIFQFFHQIGMYLVIDMVLALKQIEFVIGFPLLMYLVVLKWRQRHLSTEKAIEEFLQGQHNFAPIKYTYPQIKKMTNNFSEKLGEGGYGTVYKGKLRSGPYVAIKMMEQSMATEEEFISEVATIGQIHHVNVVQLIGYCVEHSKYALVYEFLLNGSLDRYIFNQQGIGVLSLTFDKMFEIALGVASGISYLHHGCNMQILHFDIKPHNILLDEVFNPKISDFGLAKLHPTHESFINLTAVRGTIGYMAPEIFYKNIGHVSYKVDVYSFGMMLMEMASKRKKINHLVDDMSHIYFPSWVYNQLCAGKDIDVNDATEEEKLIVKKILIVALWCIQMRPSDRPSMNKIVEMLQSNSEPQLPPKPFIAPCEIATNVDEITRTYSVDFVNLYSDEN